MCLQTNGNGTQSENEEDSLYEDYSLSKGNIRNVNQIAYVRRSFLLLADLDPNIQTIFDDRSGTSNPPFVSSRSRHEVD
jgi:hypothetical protein